MAFNPSEARDDHGRWTSGGGGPGLRLSRFVNSQGNVLTLDQLRQKEPAAFSFEGARKLAAESVAPEDGGTSGATGKGMNPQDVHDVAMQVAEELGYPADRISVSLETKTFTLNGKEYTYGGAAYLATGQLVLYSNHLSPDSLPGLVAHEIMHGKFQAVIDEALRESEAISKDGNNSEVLPSGDLATDALKRKYPVYSAMHDKYDNISALADDDGVTPYSMEWWKAWKGGSADTMQAVHETLAEMSRLHYKSGGVPGTRKWTDLYRAVNKTYSKMTQKL